MSTITEANPHIARPADGCWQTVYWKSGSASGAAGATHADLQVFWPGSGYMNLRRFELPAQAIELEQTRRIFARIFTQGKQARSRELLAILKE